MIFSLTRTRVVEDLDQKYDISLFFYTFLTYIDHPVCTLCPQKKLEVCFLAISQPLLGQIQKVRLIEDSLRLIETHGRLIETH